ncbi:MAG: NHL repeat-containing protein, partial [Bacteroidota bacterium]
MKLINTHLFIIGILLIWNVGAYGQVSPGGYVFSASINDSLASPVRMAIDNMDNIYVTDAYQKKIKKFNASGTYLGSVITVGSPVSIAINSANQIFFGDGETGKILKLNSNGTTTELYTGTVFPSSMVFCSDGNLYVSDSKLQRVIVLDLSGNVIRTIGAGTLTFPTGIAFDKRNNRILVAEHGGIGSGFNPVVKVRIYGLTGNLITSFGSHGNGDGKFYRIQGLAVGRCGEIYVPEPYQGNVSVFNENTIFTTRFGQYGDSISQLRVPLDIAINSQDKIFITAENNGAIEVYNINYILPTANITCGNKTICAGSTTDIPVHFTGAAPWTFTYTINGTNPSTVYNTINNPYILTVSAPGNYQVTAVSDSSRTGTCFSGNAVVTVNNVLPTATMASGNFGFCPGQMASIPINFTGVAPWTFTYTINGTNPQTVSNVSGSPYFLNVSEAGSYQISAITGGGCAGSTFSGNAMVSANASPHAVIASGNTAICAGNSTNMIVGFTGTAPWSFTYTINNTNQTTINNIVENPYQFPVSLAGMYKIIQVQDAFCLGSDSSAGTEIVVKPLPTANISSGNAAICAGNSTNIIVDLTGTSPWNFTYTMNGLNPVTINGVTSSPYVLTVSQAGTYQITDLSDAGCIGTNLTGVATITVNPLPLVSLGPPASICPGDSMVISPGTGFFHYFWSDSTTSPTLTVYSAGNYSVTVTDFNGCKNSAAKTVTSSIMPTSAITSGNASICMGATTDITIALTGTPPWSITYTVNGVNQQTVSNIITSPYLLNVYQSGIYQIIQTTDAVCSNPASSGSVLITVNPLPTYNFSSGNASICPGQSASLVIDFTGTPPWNFTCTVNGLNPVTFNGINYSPWVMQVSAAGTYEIIALSDAFCTGPAYNGTATIIVNPLPNVNLGPDVTMCDGDTVTLDAGSSFAGYLWNNGNTSQTIEVNLPGSYSVIVTDYNGCTNSDGVYVSLLSLPVSLFTSSSNGLTLNLFNASLHATSFLWTFGDNTT